MPVYDTLHLLHYVAVLLFGGFILLDRLLFRPYFDKLPDKGGSFYLQSRPLLITSAVMIVISGVGMSLSEGSPVNHALFPLKVIGGVLLTALFFYCPYFAKKAGERARQAYRVAVVLLLGVVVILSKFFI